MNIATSSTHKVRTVHLQRDAYLYVRQSSMRQVLENTESTKRQYQLRERALALGWISEQIRVIDCDQGCSGASDAGRDGFQQLVAEVSLGNAGIVMGLEVSRLARNNADWHRLLQLCAFTDTLILDQDGLYDPSAFNDRLLLGLKGAMSEAAIFNQEHTAALKALVRDFSAIWNNDSLPNRDRKRIVRLLIEDVTILKGKQLTCHIRFKGGTCRTLNLPLPQPACELRRTPPEVVKAIDELLDDHPEFKVADILTDRGMKSGTGQSFTMAHVSRIRITYGLPNRWKRLRKQGKLLARELSERLGISCDKIRRCRELGLLTVYEYRKGKYLYDDPGIGLTDRIPQLKMNAHFTASHTTKEVQYAT